MNGVMEVLPGTISYVICGLATVHAVGFVMPRAWTGPATRMPDSSLSTATVSNWPTNWTGPGSSRIGSMTSATIEEIVERAQGTEPNSVGIRVCVRREASAQAGAWGKLVEQLKSAGVADDQIDWGNDQVP
jgi:hypothetical protein